ncbi:hypothetical protein D3C81_1978780 [compost metagenome]
MKIQMIASDTHTVLIAQRSRFTTQLFAHVLLSNRVESADSSRFADVGGFRKPIPGTQYITAQPYSRITFPAIQARSLRLKPVDK